MRKYLSIMENNSDIEKISNRDNFILKGGFYLSGLFGIDNRSTMDIDAAIRRVKFTEDNLIEIMCLEDFVEILLPVAV